MPEGAGLVAPVTDAERDALRLFLTWVAESLQIGETNAGKAETARSLC